MTIDTEQQKPWYHDVRWFAVSYTRSGTWIKDAKTEGINAAEIAHLKVPREDAGPIAKLIADAPETATERDNLKAENESLQRRVIAAEKLAEAVRAYRAKPETHKEEHDRTGLSYPEINVARLERSIELANAVDQALSEWEKSQ